MNSVFPFPDPSDRAFSFIFTVCSPEPVFVTTKVYFGAFASKFATFVKLPAVTVPFVTTISFSSKPDIGSLNPIVYVIELALVGFSFGFAVIVITGFTVSVCFVIV